MSSGGLRGVMTPERNAKNGEAQRLYWKERKEQEARGVKPEDIVAGKIGRKRLKLKKNAATRARSQATSEGMKRALVVVEARAELEKELDFFGPGIREWRQRIKQELNYDPLGFYEVQLSGKFMVTAGGLGDKQEFGEVPFLPRKMQREFCREIIWHRWAATDEAGWVAYQLRFKDKPRPTGRFMRLVAKYRRAGFSTNMAHISHGDGYANAGANTLITAHSDDGLTNMEQMLRTLMGDKQKANARRFSARMFQTSAGSIMRLTAPKAAMGIGFDYNILHWTEVDYLEDIDAALRSVMPSIRKGPFAVMVLESQLRRDAVSGFKDYVDRSIRGETAFQLWFQGWMDDDTAVLDPSPAERQAIYNRVPLKGTDGYEFETLVDKRHATVEQVAWWRQRYREDADYRLAVMWEQYPTTLDEALKFTGGPQFLLRDALDHYRKMVRPPMEQWTPAFDGMKPVLDPFDAHIDVWKPMRHGLQVVIGADSADSSTRKDEEEGAECYAYAMDYGTGEQLAEYHGFVNTQQFGLAVWQMATVLYPGALIVPEVMATGSGKGLLDYLMETMGYTNVYERESFGAVKKRYSGVYGFETNKQSRTVLVQRIQDNFNRRTLLIRSKYLFTQLEAFAKRGGRPYKSHIGSRDIRDDGCIALGLCMFGHDNAVNGSWLPKVVEAVDGNAQITETVRAKETRQRMLEQDRMAEREREDRRLLNVMYAQAM